MCRENDAYELIVQGKKVMLTSIENQSGIFRKDFESTFNVK